MASSRRRGFSGWIIGLIVILVLAWCGYWYAARTAADMALDRATTRPVAGNAIGCQSRTLGGFPLNVDIACATVSADRQADQFHAELGGIKASAPLYRPGHVSATLTSPLTVNAPVEGLALTVGWALAEAEANAWLDGLSSGEIAIHSLSVENAAENTLLPIVAATARRADGAAMPAGDDAYDFSGSADGLTLTRRGGGTFPETDLEFDIRALEFGSSLGTDPRARVLAWLRRGGTAEIRKAKVRAGGTIIDTDGTLTLSPDGTLSGNLALRFANLEALADLVESLRPGSRDQIMPALAALTAMTVPVETEDGVARQTALTINNGLVAVGIIPVGVLPALRF